MSIHFKGRHARTVLAGAATLAIGLSAAGCGGSASSSTKTAATLTKAEFLARGNAICTRANATLTAAEKRLPKQPTPARVKAFVTGVFAPNIQGQIDGLRALGAPSGDQAAVTSMMDLAQADLNRMKRNPALLAGNRPPFTDFAKLAHPYGLTACAPGS